MINSTKIFRFNGRDSTDLTPSIVNATLNNDFYNFAPLGARSVREEKISGRDIPYFYDVDNETLSFPMTIAFDGFATQQEVNEVIKFLYLPKTPKLLEFPEYNLNYFGLFVGEPRFYYVGNNLDGFKFIGYIEVEFKTNAPYGWTNKIEETATTGHTIENIGDIEIIPSFSLTNTSNFNVVIKIVNTNNSTSFTYILGYQAPTENLLEKFETLTFNGYTKILSSDMDSNPYPSWNKDYLIFEPGDNIITVTYSSSDQNASNLGASILYAFRAPKIL